MVPKIVVAPPQSCPNSYEGSVCSNSEAGNVPEVRVLLIIRFPSPTALENSGSVPDMHVSL